MKKLNIPGKLPKQSILTLIIPTFISMLIFLPSDRAFSATRLLKWDFNTTTYVDPHGGDTPNTGGAGRAIYKNNPEPVRTDDRSPEGGKHIRAHVINNTSTNQTQPLFWFTDPSWNLDEFYIRFYMKIETDIPDEELESIKMFRVKCGDDFQVPGCDYTINMYPNSWHIYHTLASGTWSPAKSHPGFQQGRWVKYEFYTKYNTPGKSNGILRIWVNGALSWERTNLIFRNSTDFVVDQVGMIFHFKTFGSSKGQIDGHVRFDDIEIWDGKPGGSATPPPEETEEPKPPIGLRIIRK